MQPMYESGDRDLAALQMENELLAHEIRFLRGRLAGADEVGAATVTGATFAQHERALHDIRGLMRRLESSPVRYALRRFDGYRTLVARYGRDE